MRELFRLHKDEIIIDNLLIQPTYWCAGCSMSDCYVRLHSRGKENSQLSLDESIKLFKSFYQGPHWANQICISIDNLPKNIRQRTYMADYIASVLCICLIDTREIRPEVHLTLNSPETLQAYCEAGVPFFLWSSVDLISFSEMSGPVEKVCVELAKARVKINYNTMNAELPKYLPVDSIYYLIKKSSNPIDFSFRGEIKIEQQEDICLHHLKNNNCNTNISKFQIWPDGSVSGCPYKKISDTPNALTVEGVVDNILTSSKVYNFESCCLK